jgi:dCTP deaminase
MILSDKDIKARISDGKLGIENFNEKCLTPNGYDLTISEVFFNGASVKEGVAKVPPMTWFAVSTKEYVKMGCHCASLWIRTSWARKGVLSSFGKIDAGFEGTLTLSAFNTSKGEVEIEIGKTFAQMVFEEISSEPEALYAKRTGNYQGQRGVTLAPKK